MAIQMSSLRAAMLRTVWLCSGINTAIYSPSGANSGVGFAVPVDLIRSSVSQIIQFGKVLRPILGISFAPDQSVEQVCLASPCTKAPHGAPCACCIPNTPWVDPEVQKESTHFSKHAVLKVEGVKASFWEAPETSE